MEFIALFGGKTSQVLFIGNLHQETQNPRHAANVPDYIWFDFIYKFLFLFSSPNSESLFSDSAMIFRRRLQEIFNYSVSPTDVLRGRFTMQRTVGVMSFDLE